MKEIDIHTGLDGLDRKIVAALSRDGRASFRTVSDELGVSEKSVARRWIRMHTSGIARVIGTTRAEALDETTWFVRMRCAPDTAVRIADNLARRVDTAWVTLISGGTEVVCSMHARSRDDTDALLLRDIPRTPRVLDVSAQCELQVYTHGETAYAAKLTSSPRRARKIPTPQPAAFELDDLDRQLLTALATDGRARAEDLATRFATSASTAARRIAALRHAGVLEFTVDVSSSALGHAVTTLAWLRVAPDKLENVARAAANHPQVGFAAATSGKTNLYLSIFTPNVATLHRYLIEDLASLQGIGELETAVGIRRLKGFSAQHA